MKFETNLKWFLYVFFLLHRRIFSIYTCHRSMMCYQMFK
jgi:hypothetical protein